MHILTISEAMSSFSEIYIHKDEADWLKKGLPMPLEEVRRYVMEEPITKPMPEDFDINSYFPYRSDTVRELEDGSIIDLGDRQLEIIHTPGHSPGHICIVDKSTGYLFTGDAVYNAPLYAFFPESDLEIYRDSVLKITKIKNINKILPSHDDLPIHTDFLDEVLRAFDCLLERGLKKGQGKFQYNGVTILL